MTNKTFARIKAVLNREIRLASFTKRIDKKIMIAVAVIIIMVVALAVGALAEHWKKQEVRISNGTGNPGGFGRMMGRVNQIYPVPTPPDGQNQFVLPEDAAKSGELAIIVDNMESARNAVAQVAAKNGGSVYATSISYAANDVKNGSMVVQIPAENFDAAFSQLKQVGNRIIQESTLQIPQRHIYQYPIPMSTESSVSAGAVTPDAAANNTASDKKALRPDGTTSSSGTVSSGGSAASAPSAIAMPVYYPQAVQDKGYIKIIFADYGTSGNKLNVTNMMGVGYAGQNLRGNLWVALGVKLILLIVLIVILVVVAKKVLQHYRKANSNKPKSNVVRQMTKTRPRAVRIKKK